MDTEKVVGIMFAVSLVGYLVLALVFPEKF
ncbi:potassium-transporting ATPase subunit F [Streptomyces wuyuanensis]